MFENDERKKVEFTIFTELDKIVINFFSCQKYITDLLEAREKILSQSNNGKRGYFTFSYPGLGWVQYDHNSIQEIYKLAEMKSSRELYSIYKDVNINQRLKLHTIAALIIRSGDHFHNLYTGLEKARKFTNDNRLTYITVTNPFYGFVNVSENSDLSDLSDLSESSKRYTGEEIIALHNYALNRRFTSLFI